MDKPPISQLLLRNPARLDTLKKTERFQARDQGPAKSLLQLARKRPARCVGTISPDTFHLCCSKYLVKTWRVLIAFAEI